MQSMKGSSCWPLHISSLSSLRGSVYPEYAASSKLERSNLDPQNALIVNTHELHTLSNAIAEDVICISPPNSQQRSVKGSNKQT